MNIITSGRTLRTGYIFGLSNFTRADRQTSRLLFDRDGDDDNNDEMMMIGRWTVEKDDDSSGLRRRRQAGSVRQRRRRAPFMFSFFSDKFVCATIPLCVSNIVPKLKTFYGF